MCKNISNAMYLVMCVLYNLFMRTIQWSMIIWYAFSFKISSNKCIKNYWCIYSWLYVVNTYLSHYPFHYQFLIRLRLVNRGMWEYIYMYKIMYRLIIQKIIAHVWGQFIVLEQVTTIYISYLVWTILLE